MKITKEWLLKKEACSSGVKWFLKQKETDGLEVVKKLIEEDNLNYANWLITRIMSYKQLVSSAVYSAEQVIDIFEREYPNDDRPRKAIEAAKKYIDDPSEKNKRDSDNAAVAAYSAYSAYSASSAYSAYAAAHAAYAAYSTASASTASSTAYAAYSYATAAYTAYAYASCATAYASAAYAYDASDASNASYTYAEKDQWNINFILLICILEEEGSR